MKNKILFHLSLQIIVFALSTILLIILTNYYNKQIYQTDLTSREHFIIESNISPSELNKKLEPANAAIIFTTDDYPDTYFSYNLKILNVPLYQGADDLSDGDILIPLTKQDQDIGDFNIVGYNLLQNNYRIASGDFLEEAYNNITSIIVIPDLYHRSKAEKILTNNNIEYQFISSQLLSFQFKSFATLLILFIVISNFLLFQMQITHLKNILRKYTQFMYVRGYNLKAIRIHVFKTFIPIIILNYLFLILAILIYNTFDIRYLFVIFVTNGLCFLVSFFMLMYELQLRKLS